MAPGISNETHMSVEVQMVTATMLIRTATMTRRTPKASAGSSASRLRHRRHRSRMTAACPPMRTTGFRTLMETIVKASMPTDVSENIYNGVETRLATPTVPIKATAVTSIRTCCRARPEIRPGSMASALGTTAGMKTQGSGRESGRSLTS